jgi:hypothetical protein
MVRERQILAGSGLVYPPEDFPPERVGVQLWQAMQRTVSSVAHPPWIATRHRHLYTYKQSGSDNMYS